MGYARIVRARASAAVIALALAAACAVEPEPVEPAEFAELCGQAGPVQILHFEPWRRINSARYWATFGERRVMNVRYEDTRVGREAVWSAGLCGEAPRRLVTGNLQSLYKFAQFEFPFVCDFEIGRIQAIDPTGEHTPKTVFEAPGHPCYVLPTDIGVVNVWPDAVGSETGALVLQPWPDDVWSDEVEPVVLLDSVNTYLGSNYGWAAMQGGGDEVLAVTGDDELVRVAVAEGSVEVIATGVRGFQLSYETADPEHPRRYLLWQRVEVTHDDPELPEGEILLLDRVTNELTSLGEGSLQSVNYGLSWLESGLMTLRLRLGDELVLRLFRLPTLDFLDVDGAIDPDYMLADDRHLVVKVGEDGSLAILDSETGELQTIDGNPANRYFWEQRVMTLLPEAEDGEGELLLLSGGDPPELVAERATYQHALLPDGRVLSTVNQDEDSVGELIVIDPASFAERLIDREVYWFSPLPIAETNGDATFSYAIREGDRAGIWLARLRPRDARRRANAAPASRRAAPR
jgi:hypothetical protein